MYVDVNGPVLSLTRRPMSFEPARNPMNPRLSPAPSLRSTRPSKSPTVHVHRVQPLPALHRTPITSRPFAEGSTPNPTVGPVGSISVARRPVGEKTTYVPTGTAAGSSGVASGVLSAATVAVARSQ